jgi:hypothetical protein
MARAEAKAPVNLTLADRCRTIARARHDEEVKAGRLSAAAVKASSYASFSNYRW